jgi:hypothetical protein
LIEAHSQDSRARRGFAQALRRRIAASEEAQLALFAATGAPIATRVRSVVGIGVGLGFVTAAVAEHPGPLFALRDQDQDASEEATLLAAYRLHLDPAGRLPVRSSAHAGLKLCPLTRALSQARLPGAKTSRDAV